MRVKHGKSPPQITNVLAAFHLSCLRKILKIYWRDKIRDDEVLSRAEILVTW